MTTTTTWLATRRKEEMDRRECGREKSDDGVCVFTQNEKFLKIFIEFFSNLCKTFK